ncbi:MAG: pyruvate ferredoxin oxidoreductase [Candidatus Woesearchaeota archaeon]
MAKKGDTKVIEASTAVALGARLSEPSVIPMYPITPQTHIVEKLAEYINNGEMACEMIHAESEHAAISACLGASVAGARTFTATSSQGLALMFEVLPIISGMRLPMVMAVANRALSSPINIWNDHSDTIACRDSGWIQLYVESAQEALDTILMAFKISEKGLLPVMVCLDGFTLSHVYEPVSIPSLQQTRRFLPRFKPVYPTLDPKKPMTFGPVAFPDTYMEFKKAEHEAVLSCMKLVQKTNKEFNSGFRRSYGDGVLELYRMQDAQYAILGMGTLCGTAREVVDELRKSGKKVGLIKLKCFRPFPAEELKKVATGLKGIAVIDRDISYGYEGVLCTEVKSAVNNPSIKVSGFIAGLGGRDIKLSHIRHAIEMIGKRDKEWLL